MRVSRCQETLSARFEAIAQRYPENIALEYEGLRVSYRELNGMANSLAREIVLRYASVTGPSPRRTRRSPCTAKSLEMVVALLAVLKTGAAYVPISCHYPQARIRHILEETRAALVIAGPSMQTAAEALAAMMPHPQAVLTLGDLSRLPHERHNLPVVTAAERLGAIIYTSGSTGVPKGVMLEQQAMCGLATASGTRSRPKMSCCSCPARRSTRRRSKCGAPCSTAPNWWSSATRKISPAMCRS